MRFWGLIVIAALAACSSAGGDARSEPGASPFPVARGSALPPPTAIAREQAAPPEGVVAGGVDFGAWRTADPATYGPAFQALIRARYRDVSVAETRADLERNGFACEESSRLDCRIEIMERQCAIDWYVVIERNRTEPVAGFDRMCLGAR